MLVIKGGAYLYEAPYRGPTLEQAPDITHYASLERLARVKHSSLL
jgi:hypothetical protein